MKKIRDAWVGLKTFLGEVRTELKKCAWPDRQELMESTVVVIVSVILLGIFVGLSDALLSGALGLVLR